MRDEQNTKAPTNRNSKLFSSNDDISESETEISKIRNVPTYPGIRSTTGTEGNRKTLTSISVNNPVNLEMTLSRSEISKSKDSLSFVKSLGKSIESIFTWKSTSTIVTESLKYEEDENKDRGNWSRKLDFMLSCIGFAVGLGNVWRFPYLCYRNGGGAFLIPYTIMLTATGLPLFFLELAFGQFASLGPTGVWKISPLFKGVGYAMLTLSCIVGIYYNMIISYVVRFFFASFTSEVPWARCNNTWNTASCVESSNNTSNITSEGLNPTYPAEEFWENHILDKSEGIDVFGDLKWELVLCLLFSWVVVFLCIIKGVKSIGKVVYFTAVFPYVVLVILLIRGVTLPGSMEGVTFYLIPKWEKLKSARVWGDAAIQIFYSLGSGWGGLIVMASYNKFHNNCCRDAIIVAIANCCTSVFAGFVIFSMIGFMAHELNVSVDNVTDSGPGLAFVAYPAGIAMMPLAPFWAVLFFFMLFTLGLDSMFTGVETVITGLADEFAICKRYKILVTATVCGVCFILGLPQCTQAGIYWMNLMDTFSAGYALIIVTLLEVLVIMHIYGITKFCDDIENMIGYRPNIYWRSTWGVVTPLTIVFIIGFNIWQYGPVKYNNYVYPRWTELIGWFMVVLELMWIPIIAIKTWWSHIGGLPNVLWYIRFPWSTETLKQLTKPTASWGPALKKNWVYKTKDMATQTDARDMVYARHVYDNPAYDDSKSNFSIETNM